MPDGNEEHRCCMCRNEATKQNVWTSLWFCDRKDCWDTYVKLAKVNDPAIVKLLKEAGK